MINDIHFNVNYSVIYLKCAYTKSQLHEKNPHEVHFVVKSIDDEYGSETNRQGIYGKCLRTIFHKNLISQCECALHAE